MVKQRAWAMLAIAGAVAAVGLAAHTAVNLRSLRRPDLQGPDVDELVSILIPARDEQEHIATTVTSALDQTGLTQLEVIVLDDDSADDTAAIVDAITHRRLTLGGAAPRLVRSTGDNTPAGWLGKPWACARLADEASGSLLVFVDADVELAPEAVRALAQELRTHDFAMVAPYPHQAAVSWLERLVQPLVTWSWAATLPLRWAESSDRPSLSAANGQLLMVDAAAYRAAGGHAAVRAQVLEDISLMKAFKRAGLRTATVDGSHLATCRMYTGPRALVDGYAKSLWAAFPGRAASVGANGMLLVIYVAPPLAALLARSPTVRAAGAIGYAAGVTSRALVAQRVGDRVFPDTLAHPASIVAFASLNAVSWTRHIRGTNSWKGRPVVAAPQQA